MSTKSPLQALIFPKQNMYNVSELTLSPVFFSKGQSIMNRSILCYFCKFFSLAGTVRNTLKIHILFSKNLEPIWQFQANAHSIMNPV